MSIEGIILMWFCYIPIFFACVKFIVDKSMEQKNVSYLLTLPLILLGIFLSHVKRTDIKPQKEKYEQVTETFYRKIK